MKISFFKSDIKCICIHYKTICEDVIDKKEKVLKVFEKIEHFFPKSSYIEVSTRSNIEIGKMLSPFNLNFRTRRSNRIISVESAYHGSKVFEDETQLFDLYDKNAFEAKMDKRLWGKKVLYYNFLGKRIKKEPETLFFNWLYLKTLEMNKDLLLELKKYEFFSDTAFNPYLDPNCQARACAIGSSLLKLNIFYDVMKDITIFEKYVYKREEEVIQLNNVQEQYSMMNYL